MKLIISKEIDRGDIIEVEKRKWFEKQLGHEAFELKEERKEESINFLKKLPYSEDLWGDIGKAWEIIIEVKDYISLDN